MAEQDRERYNRECQLRDEDAIRRQEEKRKAFEITDSGTDTRMRATTVSLLVFFILSSPCLFHILLFSDLSSFSSYLFLSFFLARQYWDSLI